MRKTILLTGLILTAGLLPGGCRTARKAESAETFRRDTAEVRATARLTELKDSAATVRIVRIDSVVYVTVYDSAGREETSQTTAYGMALAERGNRSRSVRNAVADNSVSAGSVMSEQHKTTPARSNGGCGSKWWWAVVIGAMLSCLWLLRSGRRGSA